MANTLTNLIPAAYEALDVVSRELTGIISAVNLDASSDTMAKGQTVYSPVAPTGEAVADISPAMTVTAASDQTIGTKSISVDNFKTKGFNSAEALRRQYTGVHVRDAEDGKKWVLLFY